MDTIGTLPSKRLAGLSEDLFHKLQSGSLTEDELALFTQRKNPFAFEHNEHGHIVLSIVGLNLLTGEQEVERLIAAGFRVGDWAKSCLTSTKADGYDKSHRLVAGQVYKIALMPTKEIERDADRTTANLRTRGIEKYAYGKPFGGIAPRIRQSVSDKQMEEMRFWYIAAPHDPIKDSGGGPYVLNANRNADGQWLNANFGNLDNQWHDYGAFAFLVPETLFISRPASAGLSFWQAVHSTRRAFYQLRPIFQRARYTFLCRMISSPIGSCKATSTYLFFLSRAVCTAIFLRAEEMQRPILPLSFLSKVHQL